MEKREERREKGESSEVGGQRPEHYPLSTSHYPLFSVRTPTAVVTDLGTEFGVEVGKNGDTTSHVFQGLVRVQVVGDDGKKDVVLRAHESARIEMGAKIGGLRLLTGDAAGTSPKFVRRITEPLKLLDLLDIVAGGDGRGKLRERGIDPVSGRYAQSPIEKARDGEGQYRPILWNRYRLIDGVFVPCDGSVQLDSAGDTFDGFSDLTGRTYGYIWARAAKTDPNEQYLGEKPWIYMIERSERFMPGGRGLLIMHANAGITFNLQAVRERYSGLRPDRFQATIGLADSSAVAPMLDSKVDFRVFVDGRLTWKRIGLTRRDGVVEVTVDLGPRDRFLTLAATDGGDSIAADWFVVGDPVLKMTSSEQKKLNQ